MPVDIEELEPTTRNDYRRANGAPMVMVDGKSERYSRPSSFAKPLDDESALVNWKIDRACIGVAGDRALQARWVALDPDDEDSKKGKQTLRENSISAGRGAEAADIGTALHAMSVRWEQEPHFSPPSPYLESLEAYERCMLALGLKSMFFEFHTVNRQYRCAGTGDRVYEAQSPLRSPDGTLWPPGTLFVGDLKTGGKLEYSMPAYAVQLDLYAEGEFYDVVHDTFMPTPAINQDWAILVHMPAETPGLCEMLWVDLEVGRWGAYLVDQIKRWRKSWRSGEFAMPPVEMDADARVLVDEPPLGALMTAAEVALGLDDEQESVIPEPTVGYGLAEYVAWFKLRLSYIAAHDGARKRLTILWPEGLPTPKQGIDDSHVEPIQRLLSQIEAEFSLGFVEGGPQTSGHRSTLKGT